MRPAICYSYRAGNDASAHKAVLRMAKTIKAGKGSEPIPVPVPKVDPKVTGSKGDKKMKSDVVREIISAETVYNLTTEQINDALAQGWVWWENGTPENPQGSREGSVTNVTLGADKSPTKLDEIQPYQKLLGITFEGMILLCGGKAEPAALRGDTKKPDLRTDAEKQAGVADHFNYGLDLEVKRPIRKALENSLAGPDKAIRKMAQALLDLKMARNMDHALEKARKQYEEEMAENAAESVAE